MKVKTASWGKSLRRHILSLKIKLLSGSSWTLGSYLVGFGTQGLYFVLLARSLEVNEFGVWAGALALTTVFGGLVGLGAGNVLVVRASKSERVLTVQLGAALIYIAASAIPLGVLAWLMGHATSEVFAGVLFSLLVSELVAVRVFDLALQVFQARDDLASNAVCRTIGGSIRLLAIGLFYLFGDHTVLQWSYWYASSTAMSAILAIGWAMRGSGRPKFALNALKDTWKTGIFFAVGVSSRTLYLEADKYILNRFDLAGPAGSLSAAGRIITMAFAPIQAIVYSSNTLFFRAGDQGAHALWKVMKRPFVFTLVYGGIAGGLICAAAPFTPLLLGASYSEVSGFLVWLSPLIILNGIHYLFGDALMGLGRQGPRSIAQFLIASLSVVGNIIWIPIYGVTASILVTLGCSLCLAGTMVFLFIRLYKNTQRDLEQVRDVSRSAPRSVPVREP